MKEKLIRDKIVASIMEQGNISKVRVTNGHKEHRRFLQQKLIEEANEVIEAVSNYNPGMGMTFDIIEELADLTEVITAIRDNFGIAASDVEEARLSKKEKRGGFECGYILKLED